MNKQLRRDLGLGLAAFGLTSALLLTAGPTSAQSTSPAFKPGLWSLTRTMNGGPGGGARDGIEQICFDAAMLTREPIAPLRMRPPAREANAPQCTIADLKAEDGRASYTAACKGPMGTIRGNWTGTYGETRFDVTGKMKVAFMSMTARYTGRYLGACKK
jgi:Protein of unknown function (DUF3617)